MSLLAYCKPSFLILSQHEARMWLYVLVFVGWPTGCCIYQHHESSKNINSQTKSVIDGSYLNFVQLLRGRPMHFFRRLRECQEWKLKSLQWIFVEAYFYTQQNFLFWRKTTTWGRGILIYVPGAPAFRQLPYTETLFRYPVSKCNKIHFMSHFPPQTWLSYGTTVLNIWDCQFNFVCNSLIN